MSNADKSAEEKRAEARLRELDAEIEALSAKADRVKADAQVHGKKLLDEIRGERDALAAKLEKARSSTDSALKELGEGFTKAIDDVAASIRRANDQMTKDDS